MSLCNYFHLPNKFFTIKRQAYPLPCSPLVSVWSLNSSLLLTTCLPCRLSPGPLSPAMAEENWWRWFSIIQLVLRTKGLYFLERQRKHMSCKLKCGITEAINNQEHLNSCPRILSNMQGDQHLSVKYDDIFGSLAEQREAVKVLARILEIRDQL